MIRRAVLPLLLPALLLVGGAGQDPKQRSLPLPDRALTQFARESLSPDGKTVAAAGDKICFTDAATGELQRELRPGATVTTLAFSPRGRLLATGDVDHRVSLWALRSATRLTHWKGHGARVQVLAFSPAGDVLASGDVEGTIALWQVIQGKPRWLRRSHDGPIRALAFSPSGKLLASCGDDRVIRLWEVVTARPVLAVPAGTGLGACAVAFAADGRTLFWTQPLSPAISCWDLAAGKFAGKLELLRLETTPHEALLHVGDEATVRVRAHWADGRAQDVTQFVRSGAGEGDILRVLSSGRVAALRPGRTAVTVRYLGRTAAAVVTVRENEGGAIPAFPAHNFVDELLVAEWKKAGFRPAAPLADVAFLRRAYLQLLGTIPTPAEVRRFEARKDPDRRRKLIDELLNRPEYAAYWGLEWAQLLGIYELKGSATARTRAHGWLRQALAQNLPARRIVRELLLAEGKVKENGAAALAAAAESPERLAQTVGQAFLGVNLACARCHPHPDGLGGPDDYRGLVACFSQVSVAGGADPTIRSVPDRRLLDPVDGKAVRAHVPGEAPFPAEGQRDPRRALADWLTARANPALARNLVNRYWAHFYSEALVEPVDGAYGANVGLYPALLDALTKDFLAHNYDLKRLVRTLCQARAYQLGLAPGQAGKSTDAAGLFARRPMSCLRSEINDRIVAVACDLPLPSAAAALGPRLSDPGPFGLRRHQRYADGTCERDHHPLLGLPFSLGNEKYAKLLSHPKGRLARLLDAGASDDRTTDELFLAMLSRLPTVDERSRVREHLRQGTAEVRSRRERLTDLLWALLNTTAFAFCP